MQDTVDPAAAPPRTLAQIIEDAARCAATAWLTARRGRSAVPARTVGTRQGSPTPGPDQRGGHGVMLRAAGHVFTFAGATVIFGSGERPVRDCARPRLGQAHRWQPRQSMAGRTPTG
jgi:hypothetical protein